MLPSPVFTSALLVALFAAGCHHHDQSESDTSRGGTEPPRPADTQPGTFTGTLRGSTAAVGGETTGWRLTGDNQTGGIDVDVSKVRERAKELDGRRVTVAGKMTTRHWPERGDTQVLVADRIDEATRKDAGAAPGR